MNVNRIDNNSFKGNIILREKMFPQKGSQIVATELKELVETFQQRTANQSGTMFVQKITKDVFNHSAPYQMNTYFKNGNYTDALAVNDEHLFEAFKNPNYNFNVKEAIDKLVCIFNRFKEREQVVTEEIKPIKDKIIALQKELKEKKTLIDTKPFEHEILSSAQPEINGQNLLDFGLCYDYFDDIEDCLKLQNKIITDAK